MRLLRYDRNILLRVAYLCKELLGRDTRSSQNISLCAFNIGIVTLGHI